jgi:uncharacterized protein (DUF58 family)
LLAAAGLFIVMGLALRNGEVLAMALPVLFLSLVLFLATRRQVPQVEVQRDVERTDFLEEDDCRVHLTVANKGEHAVDLRLVEKIPASAVLKEGRVDMPLHLDAGETVEVEYVIKLPRRGKLEIGPARIEWRDLAQGAFGEVVLRGSTSIRVLPPLVDLDRCDLLPHRVRMYSGSIPAHSVGQGGEFFALRPYEEGDEARRINWKATLRTGQLYSTDMEAERSGDVVMVVDARRKTGRSARGDGMIDREVEAASSMAAFYLREKNRVGLVSISDLVDVLPAASGRRHFHMMTDRLLNVHAGGERPFTGLKMALRRYFSPGALVIVLTPLDDQDQMAVLKDLARSGYQVMVISPGPNAVDRDVYARLSRLQRDDDILDLRRHCTVIDWAEGSDLSRHLMRGRGN